MKSDKKKDSYKGWAIDVHFVKQNSETYQHYIAAVDVSKRKDVGDEWTYCPSRSDKDDNILIYHKFELKVLIVFHLHSFLWNYPTPEEMEEED